MRDLDVQSQGSAQNRRVDNKQFLKDQAKQGTHLYKQKPVYKSSMSEKGDATKTGTSGPGLLGAKPGGKKLMAKQKVNKIDSDFMRRKVSGTQGDP